MNISSLEPYKKEEVLVEYSAVFPKPYPSQTRHLLPNQDYGAFKSIDLQNPKIEVAEIEVVNEAGRRKIECDYP